MSVRISHLDGLRGIAAFCVFANHILVEYEKSGLLNIEGSAASRLLWSILTTIDLGRFGVVLFFLISGFVIPFSLKGAAPIKCFAIGRFFRLYPAFWLAVGLIAVIAYIDGKVISPFTLAANLTMLPKLLGAPLMSSVFWTLLIEMIFYFVVAILFALGLLFRPGAIFGVGIVLVLATMGPFTLNNTNVHVPFQYNSFHLSFLFSGLLFRIAEDRRWVRALLLSLLAIQIVSAVYLSNYSLARNDLFATYSVTSAVLAYVAAVLFFFIVLKVKKPTGDFWTFIGAISYSVYLFHMIVFGFLIRTFPLSMAITDIVIVAGAFLVTTLVSWLVYNWVELPSIALGKTLSRSGRPSSVAAE